ncbi:MAG: MMPL family transporter [Salinisphaeraceae bacterium]|nr:MMPL family transporter [Salinisphaeraceae bacterium]
MLLLTLVVAIGTYRLTLQTDYRYFFDKDNPDLIAFTELETNYGGTDDIVLGLMPDSGDALKPENILRLADIHDALLDTPFALRVSSVANLTIAMPGAEPGQGPQITSLRVLAEAGLAGSEQWQQAITEVRRLATGTLLAQDGSIAAAHVRIELPEENDFWDSRAVYKYTQQVRDRFEAEAPDTRVLLAGVLPYYHLVLELAIRDVYALFPFCLLVAALMLRLLLGSWRASAVCAVPVLCAVVTSIGICGWMGIPVSAVTMGVPILIMVIALAYAVHLTDTHLQLRSSSQSAVEAARQSLQENFSPVLLTGGTTILGFLAMNISIAPPYRDMGNTTAAGVAVSVVYVLLVLPALLGMVDPPHHPKRAPLRRWLEYLAKRYSRPIHSPWLVGGTLLVIVGLLACIPLNTIDDDMSGWLSDKIRLRQDHAILGQRLTGMVRLYYSLPAPAADGVHDPDYLGKVEEFADWLQEQEAVVAVRMLPPLVRGLNASFGDGSRELPQNPELTEQLLWTYEFSAPPGDRFSGLVNSNRTASVVLVLLEDSSGHELHAFDRRARAWLDEHAGELNAPSGRGGMMMFSRMVLQNIPPMIFGTLGVLFFAAMLIGLVFKSWRLALISLVPNLLPIGLAFGTWGLISGHVGVGLSVICTAAVGIIVDDCIHLMARYHEGRQRRGSGPGAGCDYAIRRVGGAITITTVVLCLGIGMIGFSQLQPTHELGVWLSIAIAYAWFCDLFLLPQLLLRFDKAGTGE